MTDIHTFKEMLAHLESGGVAHHWGSQRPLYFLSKGRLMRVPMSIEERMERTVHFSVEDQQSVDWVFMSREEFEEERRKTREAWLEWQERKRQSLVEEELNREKQQGWLQWPRW